MWRRNVKTAGKIPLSARRLYVFFMSGGPLLSELPTASAASPDPDPEVLEAFVLFISPLLIFPACQPSISPIFVSAALLLSFCSLYPPKGESVMVFSKKLP
jgi:hypothetical protein